VNLPRGLDRELVRDRDREYTLRGAESRTLATDFNTTEIVAEANRRTRDAEARILAVAAEVDPRALLATLSTLRLTHRRSQTLILTG
jgi:hypothetical protein